MIKASPHTDAAVPAAPPALNERAQQLLKNLVTRYIRDGQPVGSRTLSKDSDLSLSPATIRNVMADLEEMGLVASPHTSAGRIPTAKGYRIFVDSLLQIQPLDMAETLRLRQQLLQSTDYNKQNLLQQASDLLSEITHLAGIVMLPKQTCNMLRQVEFLPLSEQRVLVIMVINEQEVRNSIINASREYSPSELQQAANYLNRAFAGKSIQNVRRDLLKDMEQARTDMNLMMQVAIEIADQVFQSKASNDYVMSGQTHLMQFSELSNIDKLRHLFEAFNRKRDILHLLDQALNAEGVQIFIGEESGYEILDECSVVTSPYEVNGEVLGVLGVIGPTRMAYERVIPIVDITARLVGAALKND